MPFTFAHPAIVLPLRKVSPGYFSLTALIIGSVVPDFEYFIRMKILSEHSHTFAGLFYFDLPVGLLLYLIFVTFVRIPIITHLPMCLRQRCRYDFRSMNLIVVVLSIVVGAVTHLFWDSFTHVTGYAVLHISLLQTEIVIGHYSLPGFKILQHVSTFVGIVFIVFTLIQQPREIRDYFSPSPYYWFIVLIILALTALGRYLTGNISNFGDRVVAGISGVLLGTLIASIFYYARFPDRRAI